MQPHCSTRSPLGLLCFLMVAGVPLAAVTQEAQQDETSPPKKANRLASESSPYLLQHAHNPVDWYPWGDEAFDKARRENKMVFLSVGYAACHWCHVMERESFMDAEIAERMNDDFVCVKVDREERPDVDQIYMTAVQLISGHGGWPMSVFLMPDGRPFWGGTYFPARTGDRGSVTGFLSVLEQIQQAWVNQPEAVEKQADQLTSIIKENQTLAPAEDSDGSEVKLQPALVDRVAAELAEQFDPQFGGFGYSTMEPNQPKFPEPSNLVFLLDRLQRTEVSAEQREQAAMMLWATLDGMISGAMWDHVGGGFHRYSVDRRWQIPHFEKMLYDNGQLASVFATAYRESGRQEYRYIAEGICDFVIRELRDPRGGFYSSLDADSEDEEGKFYRWTKQELESIAAELPSGKESLSLFAIEQGPNFEGVDYALSPRRTLTSIAEERGQSFPELDQELTAFRAAAMQRRSQRMRPATDTKILTAWNGLMIAGLADAGRLLNRPDYTQAAIDAANFVQQHLQTEAGRLQRSHAAGESKLNAYVDDYAFFAAGLLALHRATSDQQWLARGRLITDQQLALFWDETQGGFFFTSIDHPSLVVRVKDPVDSEIPSGASVTAENLMYLAAHSEGHIYQDKLERTLRSVMPMFDRAPVAVTRMATVAAELLSREP